MHRPQIRQLRLWFSHRGPSLLISQMRGAVMCPLQIQRVNLHRPRPATASSNFYLRWWLRGKTATHQSQSRTFCSVSAPVWTKIEMQLGKKDFSTLTTLSWTCYASSTSQTTFVRPSIRCGASCHYPLCINLSAKRMSTFCSRRYWTQFRKFQPWILLRPGPRWLSSLAFQCSARVSRTISDTSLTWAPINKMWCS